MIERERRTIIQDEFGNIWQVCCSSHEIFSTIDYIDESLLAILMEEVDDDDT